MKTLLQPIKKVENRGSNKLTKSQFFKLAFFIKFIIVILQYINMLWG